MTDEKNQAGPETTEPEQTPPPAEPPAGPEGEKTPPMTLTQRLVPIVVVVIGLVAIVYFVIPIMKERNRREEMAKEYRANRELAETVLKDQGLVCSKVRIQEAVVSDEGKILRIECQEEQKKYEIIIDAAQTNFAVQELLP